MPFFRTVLRWSLIAGIGVGALAMVVGPNRVGAAADQIRTWSQDAIDRMVDDPIALRRQLEQLGAEYPGRIGQLRGEISQLDRQLTQLSQECEVSRRVVAMTTSDLEQMQTALAAAAPVAAGPTARTASLHSRDASEAGRIRAEAKRVQHIRSSHQDRLTGGEKQLVMLKDQREKLATVLQKLEREHGDFQVKLAALDRQIDAVGRNQRLIEMAREQAKVLAEYERCGRVGNLGQLEGRLEQIRLEQEAQLQVLLQAGEGDPYEAAARESIRNGESSDDEAPPVPSSLQANLGAPTPVRALLP
ncbi:MAG: hypothetical protein FJ253_02390 [Phycisphaerae bacterium]|nr:hypothetical protein [Phycisphaerae bacterium]